MRFISKQQLLEPRLTGFYAASDFIQKIPSHWSDFVSPLRQSVALTGLELFTISQTGREITEICLPLPHRCWVLTSQATMPKLIFDYILLLFMLRSEDNFGRQSASSIMGILGLHLGWLACYRAPLPTGLSHQPLE